MRKLVCDPSNTCHCRSVSVFSVPKGLASWNDLPQLTGGSDQGTLNPNIVPPKWDIYLAPDTKLSVLWMQVVGVEGVGDGEIHSSTSHAQGSGRAVAGEAGVIHADAACAASTAAAVVAVAPTAQGRDLGVPQSAFTDD